jgi:hypothetical protein
MRHLFLLLASTCHAPADGGAGGGGAVERLHDLKPISRDSSDAEWASGLNEAISAIREVAGDAAKVRERVDAALPALEAKFAAAKRSEGVEIVPLGDIGDFERRYLDTEGRPMLGRHKVRTMLPDGTPFEFVRQGMLTEAPVTAAQARVQRAYGSYALAFKRAQGLAQGTRSIWSVDSVLPQALSTLQRELKDLPGRSGAWFRSILDRADWAAELRAISNTTGSGGELIFNPQLTTLRRPSDMMRRIPGLIQSRPAPSKSFTPLSVTGRAIPTVRGVIGDDPSMFETSNFSTTSTTVTVVDRDVNARTDKLWVVDAAKILGDPLGFVSSWLDEGDLLGLEIAFLHGDTTATHEDTLSTWTFNGLFSAGALAGSNKLTRAWKGFRRIAVDDSNTASGGGTWDISDHTAALALMGVHERDAVIITGLNCLLTQLVGNSNFLTVDKMGPYASLITGSPGMTTVATAGSIGGKPIYISEVMGKQFDTSSGLYTGSNLGNEMVYVNPKAFVHYELEEGSEDYDVYRAERGQQILGLTRRSILVKELVTGEEPCAFIYNL